MTVYVGDVRFTRPVAIGELVEVEARLVHTGRTSMHILVVVSSADPKTGEYTEATRCITVFVAVDGDGRPVAVPTWTPPTPEAAELQAGALRSAQVRADIEASMKEQTYTEAGTAPGAHAAVPGRAVRRQLGRQGARRHGDALDRRGRLRVRRRLEPRARRSPSTPAAFGSTGRS